jgi:hypothetical protein
MYGGLAIFLLLHGMAHLVGFMTPWGIAGGAPVQSSLLAGRISIGIVQMKALGIFWLGGATAFTIAALGVWHQASWWPSFLFGTAIASLVLCILSYPQSKVGIPINLALIIGLLMTHREVVAG